VRNLHKPVLTITEEFTEPKRVMIAFDGGIVTRKGVKLVAKSPLFKGLPIHLLMSGKERADAAKQLKWARKTLETAGFETTTAHIPGDAEAVIAKTIKDESIDMLIMGAYSHSPLRSLLFGSKTSDLLRTTKIPTLLLRQR
jgi:nucleotide-binding universal stress UspA family protein